jgi:transposase
MNTNTSISIGNIALMDKIDREYNLFDFIFCDLIGKTKHLKESAKLFVSNRLGKCVSVNRITSLYPRETFEYLGYKNTPKERTTYRDLVRIGKNSPFIIEKYQQLLKKNNLISDKQFIDWSSSYFEGNKSKLGKLGYSRDKRPDKKQITWGISTGINGIPTALTIQKGNVVDKQHFKSMLKTVDKVLKKSSLLIFDCGANTKENKNKIVSLGYNYLTLKQKQVNPYKKYIQIYKESKKDIFVSGEKRYKCVHISDGDEHKYIFFSKKLYKDQIRKRNSKFKKELKKNDKLLKKVKNNKEIARYFSNEGEIILRGEIENKKIRNPYINGLEGFFILESSMNLGSLEILKLYKKRDQAEKLIRDMKEGTELRPIRHFSNMAIIGYLTIVFLTNCIIQLTYNLSKNSDVKNLKLLKKYLESMTVTTVNDKSIFKFRILSNVLPEIRLILGDFVENYEDKSLNLRW